MLGNISLFSVVNQHISTDPPFCIKLPQ